MHRSTPRPRLAPGTIVGYVAGRPVHVIAGGSGEDDPPPNPIPPSEPPAADAAPPTPADVAAVHAAQAAEAERADAEENVQLTQRRLSVLLTREKDQGRQAALRALAADAGLDPEAVDAAQLKQVLTDAKKARDAQLSEEQRRETAFTQREKAVAAKEAAAAKALADATVRLQEANRTTALARLGAAGHDLEDALVLLGKALEEDPDADAITIARAAKDLKKRRPGLFGAEPAPQQPTAPPAPSGAPAGGPPPRQAAPASKPGDAGRAMAARMFGTDSAA